MTPDPLQTIRRRLADRKRATAVYPDCLQRNAPEAERHAAEVACATTMAALKAFNASL